MDYLRKSKKILSTLVKPVKSELSFYVLFLLAIGIIPLRMFVSHIHYLYFDGIENFLLYDFSRAGAVAYLATWLVYLFKRYAKVAGYMLATILLAVCLFLHLVFDKTLQPDIITLIAETNAQESSEFFSSFLFTKGGIVTIGATLLYVLLVVVCERKRKVIESWLERIRYKVVCAILFVLFVFQGFLNFKFYYTVLSAPTVDVLPNHEGRYDAVSSLFYSLYSIRLVNVEMNHAVEVSKNIPASSVQLIDTDSLNVVYVIGESYIKNHSQLYGYYLPTAPNLCKENEQGNLYVFDDVVSPYNQTTLVMKNTFCCNSLSDGEKWSDSPFFPVLFKKAGYDIYFWDAQIPQGPQASKGQGLNNFSMLSFYYDSYFMNHVYKGVGQGTYIHDNDLVNDFEKVHMEGKHNLVIFHLMGQHVVCTNRYPQNGQFDKFHANSILSKQPYLDLQKKQEIAEYDNATLYNDYVLKHIFDIFRNTNTVVLYFSDHGEEVYDYRDSRGRVELDPAMIKEGVRYQYEVPFMIWCSDKYKQKYPQRVTDIENALRRPFITDDISNVLFHIAGISTSVYKPTRDVLNQHYKPKDRIVGGKYNYDSIVKSSK